MAKLNSILLAAICCSTLTTFGQSKIEIGAEGAPSMTFLRGYNINNSPFSFHETTKTNSTNILVGIAYRIGA